MTDREILGYRLKMDVDRPIADFLMTSPYDVFGLVLLQCRRPWDGNRYIHLRGRRLTITWSTISHPVYHPFCIDAAFSAVDPVSNEKVFSGEIRSYRMPDPEKSIECLSADVPFKRPAAMRSLKSLSKRIQDWSGDDPDIARVITIFAGQIPFHPFWRMKSPAAHGPGVG